MGDNFKTILYNILNAFSKANTYVNLISVPTNKLNSNDLLSN